MSKFSFFQQCFYLCQIILLSYIAICLMFWKSYAADVFYIGKVKRQKVTSMRKWLFVIIWANNIAARLTFGKKKKKHSILIKVFLWIQDNLAEMFLFYPLQHLFKTQLLVEKDRYHMALTQLLLYYHSCARFRAVFTLRINVWYSSAAIRRLTHNHCKVSLNMPISLK